MKAQPDQKRTSNTYIIPCALTFVVSMLAIVYWAHTLNWHVFGASTYQIFPVIGLLAFSIMWSHYMAGTMRRTFMKDVNLDSYFRITGYVVLVAILLHPGLLAYQRFRDGYGLPPGSETSYQGPMRAWIVMLGIVSLFVFLAYEFKRWYGKRSWWKYVAYAGDLAMIAIFYHGLRLGDQLQSGWYRYVWWFYGITLVAAMLYHYIPELLDKRLEKKN